MVRSEPEVQAEPDEAQMPRLDRWMSMASPSNIFSKLMLLVLGNRFSRSPLTILLGITFSSPCSSRSLSFSDPIVLLGHAGHGQFCRPSQPDDVGHVLCSGPAPVFLVAADNKRFELGAPPDIQGADPLGGMELVPGQGEHIYLRAGQVNGNLAHCLNRVGVKDDPVCAGHFGQLLDREDDPGLVIGPHDRDYGRILANGPVRSHQG